MSAPVDQPDYVKPTLMAGAFFTASVGVVPHNILTDIVAMAGTGTLVEAVLYFATLVPPAAAVYYELRINVDGAYVKDVRNRQLTQGVAVPSGRCSIGEFYDDGTYTILHVRLPITFRNNILVRARQTTGAACAVIGEITANLVR